jgi:hypothetical protein
VVDGVKRFQDKLLENEAQHGTDPKIIASTQADQKRGAAKTRIDGNNAANLDVKGERRRRLAEGGPSARDIPPMHRRSGKGKSGTIILKDKVSGRPRNLGFNIG